MDLDEVALQPGTHERIASVLDAPETGLRAYVRAGGLDPATDFRHRDLRGWPLAREDVRGFDFTGADLRATGIERAVWDETTILADARLDRPLRARRDSKTLPEALPQGRRALPEDGYTKVRIPDLTDAELLERSFVVDDPEMLENIRAGAPPTDQWLTYEGRYDVGGRVTCAFGHRHKRGYVFRDEADRRYLVGHECGAKHLGLGRWQSFTAGRERLEERASYLRLIRDLADAFGEQREWIAGLQKEPAVTAADAVREQLRHCCPDATDAARAAFLRADGAITVRVQVRDYTAEERRREREVEAKTRYAALDAEARKAFHDKGGRQPTTDRSHLVKQETRARGTLRGRSLFVSSTPRLAVDMAHLLMLVDRFLTMRVTPQSRRELMTVARNAKELVTRLQRLRDSVADAVDFFDQDNLERFADWADRNSFDGLRFEVRAGSLVMEKIEGGAVFVVARPARLKLLDPEPFARIQASVHRVSDRIERARKRRQTAFTEAAQGK